MISKQYRKILLACIVLLSFGMFFVVGSLEDTTNESMNKQEKTLNTLKYSFKKLSIDNNDLINKKLNDVVSDFFYYLNIKDYNTAYEMFNSDYIKDFNIDYNIHFLKYQKEHIINYKITEILDCIDTYVVAINIYDNNDSTNYHKEYFTVYKDTETIADIGIKEIISIDKSNSIEENIKIDVNKKYVLNNGEVFILSINNSSGDVFELDSTNNSFYTIYKDRKYTYTVVPVQNDTKSFQPREDDYILPVIFYLNIDQLNNLYINTIDGKTIDLYNQ